MPRGPRTPPETKAARQTEIADEKGEPLTLNIPEIDGAADEYQSHKRKRVDKTKELKEKEISSYDALYDALEKHKEKLGPNRSYTFTDANEKRKVIKLGKARITIKNAKAERKAKKAHSNGSSVPY